MPTLEIHNNSGIPLTAGDTLTLLPPSTHQLDQRNCQQIQSRYNALNINYPNALHNPEAFTK